MKEAGRGYVSCTALPERIMYFSITPEEPRSLGGSQRMCRLTANGSIVGDTSNETFSAFPGGSTAKENRNTREMSFLYPLGNKQNQMLMIVS